MAFYRTNTLAEFTQHAFECAELVKEDADQLLLVHLDMVPPEIEHSGVGRMGADLYFVLQERRY